MSGIDTSQLQQNAAANKPQQITAPGLDVSNPYSQTALAAANPQAQAQTAGQQQNFVNALQQQASGQGGPNLGGIQLQNAMQANQQQNAAQAASMRGVNPALAQRQAMQSTAGFNQQAAGQAAQVGAQQQLAAQQQLGGALQGMRAQDIQNSLGQQGLAQQAGQATMGANLATQQANQNFGVEQQKQLAGAQQYNAGVSNNLIGGLLGSAGAVGAGAAKGGMSHGGEVPGHPQVFGDSEKNDTVPAKLSPGEIVVPRSKSKDPDKAKAFIDELMKEKGKEGAAESGEGYGKVLEAHRKLESRVKALEGTQKSKKKKKEEA